MATIKSPCRVALGGIAICLALSGLGASAQAQPAPQPAVTDVDRIVAVVNNDVITARELEDRTMLIQRRLTQTKTELPPLAELRAQVLNQMVLERIQLQRAKDDGITVDEAALQATLLRLAQNNKLSLDEYRAKLAEQGVPWDVFTRDARNELILTRLREKEVDSRITVSDAEIANYIASQRGPDAKKADPGAMTQTHVRHILIRVSGGVSEPAARQQLADIRQKVLAGGDFGAFARTYSQDGSKDQGGDLGWISPGETVPDFERAMNHLQDGQISEPVRTEYGYHLIQVLGRREVKGSVKQQQETARQALGARKAEQAYSDWLRQLRDTAYIDVRLDPSQAQS